MSNAKANSQINLFIKFEIRKILRSGTNTLADIQNFTPAVTSCGHCVREIEAVIEKHKTVAKKDLQT